MNYLKHLFLSLFFFSFVISSKSFAQGFMLNGAMLQRSCSSFSYGAPFVTDGYIQAIKIVGDIAYIGGSFTSVQGQPRTNLAAINLLTGFLLPFDPRVNGLVNTLDYDMGLLFAGGRFSSVHDFQLTRGAMVDPITAVPDPSNADVLGGIINATVSDGAGGWYIGGDFKTVKGVPRSGLARINVDGTLHAFDPGVTGTVYTLKKVGTTLYVGGNFSVAGGKPRRNIAAIDTSLNTNNATSWTGHTNSLVRSLEYGSNTLYVGGYFGQAAGHLNESVVVDAAGSVVTSNFETDGFVNYSVPDGAGGWYVGGSFTMIGGARRNNLARLNSDGSVHSWNPNVSAGTITTLLLDGVNLYVGGQYMTIGGQYRQALASVDVMTGLVNTWNPHVDGYVYSLAISGGTLYVAGSFSSAGGQPRSNIVALDTTTALATAWNPGANAQVSTLLLNGTTMYVGGNFNSIGGQTRRGIAALDTLTNTNNATAWNPDCTMTMWICQVKKLVLSGTTLYVGGHFDTIGGQSRNHIAALDTLTNSNNATSWNPYADSTVYDLLLDGTTMYVAGVFTFLGGQVRPYAGAVDTLTNTNNATAWNPTLYSTANRISKSGSNFYISGYGGTVAPAGINRPGLAAFDTATGNLTAWNPNYSGSVVIFTMLLDGTTLYVGGSFVSLGGQSRKHLAALDTLTSGNNATAWDPNLTGYGIQSMAISGTTLYVGGSFTSIGGQARNGLAALDTLTNTNNATSWDAGMNNWGQANTLALSGTTLYVGGNFSKIGGQVRNGAAALDITVNTNNALAWDLNLPVYSQVLTVQSDGLNVYAGGSFLSVGGVRRNSLAAFDTTIATNNYTAWNPSADGEVRNIVSSGTTLYAAGNFTNIGGQPRSYLAAIDTSTNTNNTTAWNPNPNSSVNVIRKMGTTLYAGGAFSFIGGESRSRLAALDTLINSNQATSWDPQLNGDVNLMEVDSTTVYVAGNFNFIGTDSRFLLGAVDRVTQNATPWDPQPDSDIYQITLSGKTIYATGDFSFIGGQPRNYLAALDTTVANDSAKSWNPNMSYLSASALAMHGTALVIGGQFSIPDPAVQGLARISCQR